MINPPLPIHPFLTAFAHCDTLLSRCVIALGETNSHALLASRGLAPALLARFQNGLLYRFLRGHPTSHLELAQTSIWRGVATRLGQWHAVLPIDGDPLAPANATKDPGGTIAAQPQPEADFPLIQTRHPGPNLWTTLQKWILVLPTATEEQRARRLSLQKELERVVHEFDDGKGIGEYGVRSVLSTLSLSLSLSLSRFVCWSS